MADVLAYDDDPVAWPRFGRCEEFVLHFPGSFLHSLRHRFPTYFSIGRAAEWSGSRSQRSPCALGHCSLRLCSCERLFRTPTSYPRSRNSGLRTFATYEMLRVRESSVTRSRSTGCGQTSWTRGEKQCRLRSLSTSGRRAVWNGYLVFFRLQSSSSPLVS